MTTLKKFLKISVFVPIQLCQILWLPFTRTCLKHAAKSQNFMWQNEEWSKLYKCWLRTLNVLNLCVSETGTLMSRPAATKCVWWCTTNHRLLPVTVGSTCSNGMMTTVKPKIILSANTQQVQLEPRSLLFYVEHFLMYVFLYSPPEKPMESTVSPNSSQKGRSHHSTMLLNIYTTLRNACRIKAWAIVTLQMPSFHPLCHGIQGTTTKIEEQVKQSPHLVPNILH